ncbi:MAG: Cys-tRNA(Pro) deacylase [Firmicutes bacterium]|nr:Cys-tRNA(Pro) deacylase [Bacillota bacterium]
MAKKQPVEKTNAMRKLDAMKLPFREYTYESDGSQTGVEIASMLGQNADQVFKTLVTVGRTGEHYVFMIPVAEELDLKKAAKAVGEKSVEMVKSKELLGLTGYIHGGCSPIGMKKFFQTTVHETAILYETIIFSGGKIGYQIELSLEDLQKVIDLTTADVVKD